jgi:SAM-dependent methyltransferase
MTWKRGHTLDLLEEEHHRIYGSKWALGRDQINYLIEHGLKPDHYLLDYGCGAGRAGIHFIRYLEAGHYVGVDGHQSSLSAFEQYEIPLHGLHDRDPTLTLANLETEPLQLSVPVDFVMAFSVFNHMRTHELASHNLVSNLRDGGILVCTFGVPRDHQKLGLHLLKSERRPSQMVHDKTIDWYVFLKRSQ